MEEELLQKIYNLLNEMYQSTNELRMKSGINWYRVERILNELASQKKAEKLELNKRTCWRKF